MQHLLVLILIGLLPVQPGWALGDMHMHAPGADARVEAAAPQADIHCQGWLATAVGDAGAAQDHGDHGSHCHHCQQPPSLFIADAVVTAILLPAEAPQAAGASRHASHVPAVRNRPPRARR